jgi:fermentation-respiration switch protein FrsA (DUF1100 family)
MCCCPAAVNALFCLYCQSGCRQGTVAGALTFFPPDPPLYKLERFSDAGEPLGDNEEAVSAEEAAADPEDLLLSSNNSNKADRDSPATTESVEMEAAASGVIQHVSEAETKGQTQEQLKSPIQQFTEQAAERRRIAKLRNARDKRDARHGVTYRLSLDPRLSLPPYEASLVEAVKIPNVQGASIATILYQVPPDQRNDRTKVIIYSHGNATDLGAMFPMQVVLCHALNCHVVMYDYSGYGESGGVPEEASTYADMDAVYQYVKEESGLVDGDASRIVLYGQSVGSGPCCYLAAKDDQVGGMVLHSAFTSGMRVLTPSRYVGLFSVGSLQRKYWRVLTHHCSISRFFLSTHSLLGCLDIYPNIDRIEHVNCPVMVIHGRLDQEVDICHGRDLYRAIPPEFQADPWWVPDRGHNDITDGAGKLAEYVRRLRAYLNSLD